MQTTKNQVERSLTPVRSLAISIYTKPSGANSLLFMAQISFGKFELRNVPEIIDVDPFGNPIYGSTPKKQYQKVKLSTGITIPIAFWDSLKRKARKPYENVELQIEEFKNYVQQLYHSMVESKGQVTPTEFAKAVKEYITKQTKKERKSGGVVKLQLPTHFNNKEALHTSVIYYLHSKIDQITNQGYFVHEKGKATIEGYKRFLSKVIKFETETNLKLDLLKLTDEISIQFIQFFVDGSLNYKINTINEIKKVLKAVINMAKADNIPVPTNLKAKFWKNRWEKENDPYLTFEELDKLINLNFDDEQKKLKYNVIRDMLLVGCNSGMSISDLKELKHIYKDNDGFYFEYVRQKINRGKELNQKIKVPIRQQYIIDLYIKYKKEFKFNVSEKVFNQHIKTICLLAGLNRPVEEVVKNPKTGKTSKSFSKLYLKASSKIMRKTFASNEVREYNTPLLILKRWTGHSSEAMLLNYIQLSEDDYYSIALRAVQLLP